MSKETLQNVLIVGSGGREHALGWKFAQSRYVGRLYFAPGNAGTEQIGRNVPIDAEDIHRLAAYVKDNKIHLTFVGPEGPLAKGIVNQFTEDYLKIFGPDEKAAQLESSKVWGVRFMQRHNIPHPYSEIYEDPQLAKDAIKNSQGKLRVVKADGLAAGKGVVVADTEEEAIAAVDMIMVEKAFGEAGNQVVLQERLSGQEVSVIALSDGKTVVSLLPAQDHKRLLDNDQGPNTGGMGAYAPVPFMTQEALQTIHETILQPTIDGMREEGYPFKGALYAGLMMTDQGPKVLEFNARFGDPETQPQMLLLRSDLLSHAQAVINGTLEKKQIVFRRGAGVCVVLASDGYPGMYKTGYPIHGLNAIRQDVYLFHAGTKRENGQVTTSGGRVLGVTAYGVDIADARRKAYSSIGERNIHFQGMQYSKDIGKALKELEKKV